jgi:hypothetical protein
MPTKKRASAANSLEMFGFQPSKKHAIEQGENI